MNKKYTICLIIFFIIIIIISIFTPIFKNIFKNKIIEGADISISEYEKDIKQNLEKISRSKEEIEELIQQKNLSESSSLDITTTTARNDYTSLENKSLNMQVILLAILLIIIIIAIIATLMS